MKVAPLIEQLQAARDGVTLHKIIQKLEKCGPGERAAVLAAFLAYMREGKVAHFRSFIIPSALELLRTGEAGYADAFRWGLTNKKTAYWSVAGLAKCLQRGAYPELLAFALDARQETEARAHAVQVLCELSRQIFTRGLPSEPAEWKTNALPLQALRDWRDAGFPQGRGFEPPVPSPFLARPKTEVDKLAAKLEAKLKRCRAEVQDPANPTHWLIPAEPKLLETVRARFDLPSRYLEFLSKFSPVGVTLESRTFDQGLQLFGASELVAGQAGYAFNAKTSKPSRGWNPAHVVIASHAGDPYVLDLAAAAGEDAPVLTAEHGAGSWQFRRFAPSFCKFLQKLG
ncbi:MAG TPA: SMI1/KNR4 family protein [Polyangiaceae bacterium]|nr:SMI1/KNR4 family protein [Polyangiaceae bacterium]